MYDDQSISGRKELEKEMEYLWNDGTMNLNGTK